MHVSRARRFLTALAAIACVFAAVGGVASAGTFAVKGSPQPELKPFVIAGTGNGPTAVALGPNKTFVIVYSVHNQYRVCLLDRGASKCKSTVTLGVTDGSTIFGNPQIDVVGSTVRVVMDECCAADNLVFTSTNGGKSFGAGLQMNSTAQQDISSAVFVGGRVVWDDGTDAIVDTDLLSNPTVAEQTSSSVVPNGSGDNELEYSGVGSYHGGVLVAASTFATVPSTTVYFAPEGSDPGVKSSYGKVGTFTNSRFAFFEGNALFTQKTTGSTPFYVRYFTGSGFGAAHEVPDSGGGGPQWFSGGLGSNGRVYFFSSRNQDSYDLEIESTTNGSRWSARVNHGDAVTSDFFNAGLDSLGTGIVVGSGNPIRVYPILAGQSVTVHLGASRVVVGHATTLSGTASPHLNHQLVTLERESGGLWYTVKTTHESASGKFSFSVPGTTQTYRVMVADEVGYYLYGYSNVVTLTAVARS
jgi:hypothetical protein